jgi:hypothetical protein
LTVPEMPCFDPSLEAFLKLIDALSPCVVGMEAGSGAHHWAQQIVQLGGVSSRQ